MSESELRLALKSKRQREGLNLRAAGDAIGLSYSSIWRIEHGLGFDYPTGAKVAKWLKPSRKKTDTLAAIEAIIFADTSISEANRAKLAEMFGELYAAFRKKG